MIEVRSLSVGYGKKEILHDLSAVFPDASLTVVLGPNGCGKTTLLKSLAGLLPLSGGSVLLSGQDTAALRPKQRSALVTLMPQLRHTPAMTVEELLLCARYPYLGFGKVPREADRAAVADAMERCGVAAFRSRALRTLSGGERQRVYFAMALAQGTENLLLDEPTSYLDPETQFEIFALAKESARDGKAVVLVTHDLPLALRYADTLLLLDRGTLSAGGSARELCESGALSALFRVEVCHIPMEGGDEYVVRKR